MLIAFVRQLQAYASLCVFEDIGVMAPKVIKEMKRNKLPRHRILPAFSMPFLVQPQLTGTGAPLRCDILLTEAWTIANVKTKIVELYNIQVNMSLWCDGVELEDHLTLRDYLIDETMIVEVRQTVVVS